MTRPVILVTTDQKTMDGHIWAVTLVNYLEAVAHVANAVPLQLPSLERPVDVASALAVADGVLVTGARSNVHPSCYGGQESELAAPFDRARDTVSLALIASALAAGIPLFAICRGCQELNVVRGGTLFVAVHEQPGRLDHRSHEREDMDEKFRLAHTVRLTPGGRLAAIVGNGEIEVNSVHWQGIDRLGAGLAVEAVAPDGQIEAVSVEGARAFAIGVQWHPEYWAATDPPSRSLFEAFGRAALEHHAARCPRATA